MAYNIDKCILGAELNKRVKFQRNMLLIGENIKIFNSQFVQRRVCPPSKRYFENIENFKLSYFLEFTITNSIEFFRCFEKRGISQQFELNSNTDQYWSSQLTTRDRQNKHHELTIHILLDRAVFGKFCFQLSTREHKSDVIKHF